MCKCHEQQVTPLTLVAFPARDHVYQSRFKMAALQAEGLAGLREEAACDSELAALRHCCPASQRRARNTVRKSQVERINGNRLETPINNA